MHLPLQTQRMMNTIKDFPIISGTVTDGQGQATGFTALGWLQEFFEKEFSFTPYPGTLNLIAAEEMPSTLSHQDCSSIMRERVVKTR